MCFPEAYGSMTKQEVTSFLVTALLLHAVKINPSLQSVPSGPRRSLLLIRDQGLDAALISAVVSPRSCTEPIFTL